MINLNTNKAPKDTKVVVAMSGGVDSSVVAAALKEQGYDVIGITLQLYDHGQAVKKKGACCAGSDIIDAKKVAAAFDFPHYVLNYEDLFRQSVVDDFADSYLRGETPIPCVKCNQTVKFRDLLKVAKDLGADMLATGHYVQRKVVDGKAQMFKAIDDGKDQSYFLFATTQTQLDFLRFPLGGLTKEQTRAEAQRLGLTIADKPDSQDICFVPNGDYASVISKLRPKAFKKGDIVDLNGNVLGEHEGIINYTIGQRRGLGISNANPFFVVKIDAQKNQVIVGREEDLKNVKFQIKELNWLGDEKVLEKELSVKVRLRSSQKEQNARIVKSTKNGDMAIVTMKDPTRAITVGQACVIYDGDRVLGGGWIDAILE
ncbi:MAG: tRNA 2-thiouridine(34) synthase MnmA [Proteobacteria bacterium]|nr:tRNA 2-thiouridine(34) synthase MnmA [Pseudomonadota bacterium]